MLKKSPTGYFFLEKLARQKGIVHGFSSRRFGDCNPQQAPQKNWPNVEIFLETLQLEKKNLVLMEQVHGNRIKVVDKGYRGRVIPGVDGLIVSQKGVILGVKAADCLPIFFYDPVLKIIGAVHAGWRGLYQKILEKMIEVLIRQGSLPQDIQVGVGPFIKGCCYEVDRNLEGKFVQKFGKIEGMFSPLPVFPQGRSLRTRVRLDMGVLARIQLIHSGILGKNIEFSQACTSCLNDQFFSRRKDEGETNGRQLGVICLT